MVFTETPGLVEADRSVSARPTPSRAADTALCANDCTEKVSFVLAHGQSAHAAAA
jgi:hypothetical protein